MTGTTVNCSTSGTANYIQTDGGTAFKRVIVYQAACLGTAAYTFTVPFTHTPDVIGANAATATSISTTAVTTTGVTTTGYYEIYGN